MFFSTIGKSMTGAIVLSLGLSAAIHGQTHFRFTANTGYNMIVGIDTAIHPTVNGSAIAAGDEIGVFRPGGLCVGASVWTGSPVAITVWGDNDMTNDTDGIKTNEEIKYKIWDASAGTEVPATVTYGSGGPGYATDAIATLASLIGSSPAAPSIVTQPVSQTKDAGETVSFFVTANGTPAPGYQWRKNGNPISGAISETYQITAVALADSGVYSVVVSNSVNSVVSNDAKLTVLAAPVITAQPAAQTKIAGEAVTFSVTVTGNPAPGYQWRKNGTDISGATSATHQIVSVAFADSGVYSVVVNNSKGAVTSAGAKLTVLPPPAAPVITTQPVSLTKYVGEAAEFSAGATGNPAPGYQWRKNGAPISGSTNATLHIAAVALADSGLYSVIATNTQGGDTSAEAKLTVLPALTAPVITADPIAQTKTVDEAVTFSVTATGNPAPAYQWCKNGTPITGATKATLEIASVAFADSGAYSVIATNTQGSDTSAEAKLSVLPKVAVAGPGRIPVTTELLCVKHSLARSGCSIRFALAENGPVAIEIYSFQGRLVKRLAGGVHGAGFHEATWDGSDDAGRPAVGGTYVARIRVCDKRYTTVLAMTR